MNIYLLKIIKMINFDLLDLLKNNLSDFDVNDEIYQKILSWELKCLYKDINDSTINIIKDTSQFSFIKKFFNNNECKLFLYNKNVNKYQYIIKKDYKKLLFSKITVCPYCNKNSFSWIDDDKKLSIDLDHFLKKSKYSKYWLSLFNIIPSCKDCNSSFSKWKRDYENNWYYHNIYLWWTHYLETWLKILNSSDFDEKFFFEINWIKSAWKLIDNFDEKYKKHKDFFSLDDIYKCRNQILEQYKNYNNKRSVVINNPWLNKDVIISLFEDYIIKKMKYLQKNIEK